MAADEERHVLVALVGDLVAHLQLCAVERIAGDQRERERELLEQLGVLGARELERDRALALLGELPLLLAGKTVTAQLDLLARAGLGNVLAQTAADGEAHGSLTAPHGRVSLPEILTPLGDQGSEGAAGGGEAHAQGAVVQYEFGHRLLLSALRHAKTREYMRA